MDKVYLLFCITCILYWHDLARISLDLFWIYQASKIMTQKNETLVLVITVLITTGLAGATGAVFWRFNNVPAVFNSNNELKTESLTNNQSKPAETLASVQNVPKGLFNYGGSTTWAPIRGKVDSAIQTVWPQFRLRYTQPNSGTLSSGLGIRNLLDNQLSFAQSSIALQDKDYDQAKQRGFTLKEIPVAIDAVAVVVNPSLNISGLSVDRLDDIFAGKVINWNQVGGPNLKIKAYQKGRPESGSHLEFVATTTEALNKVATEPGAIFKASASLLVSQCTVKSLPLSRTNTSSLIPPYQEPFIPLSECPAKRNQLNLQAFLNGDYPITRRLFVIIKQNNQLDQQGGEAYANLLLTEQGQELIEKAGFVRIR